MFQTICRRTSVSVWSAPVRRVSIHASAREATIEDWRQSPVVNSFNPRLRTGGDLCRGRGRIWAAPVSIHASAREATWLRHADPPLVGGFNPRLRTGGDADYDYRGAWKAGFNPRLRTGGDFALAEIDVDPWPVSIHASAREATSDASSPEPDKCRFQSTPPHGRRPSRLLRSPKKRRFQSTPPHGRRQARPDRSLTIT